MMKTHLFVIGCMLSVAAVAPVLAQPGPGPVPDPWTVNGSAIWPTGNQCITMPSSVTGGCKGNNTINAQGIYVDGNPMAAVTNAAPITSNIVSGLNTIGLDYDTNFAVNGSNALALNSIGAGDLIANCGGSSAEPAGCSWNSFANQAISASNGSLPYRTGGSWGTIATGTSGGTIPLNNTANIFSVLQTSDLGTGTEPAASTGTTWAGYGADGSTTRAELTAFNNSISGVTAVFDGRTSLGTRLSPSAVTSGTLLASFEGKGYDSSVWTGTGASFHVYAESSTWTTSSHPGEACMASTASGATSSADWLCLHNDGGVTLGSPTGGDEGASTLNLTGALYNNGTAPVGTGAYVRANSPTLSGTIGGTLTFSGNVTNSAQLIETGTSAPSSAAGNTVVMGTLTSPPTLSNNGQAFFYNTAANGAVAQGQGSTYDVALADNAGNVGMGILTGSTTAKFVGGITATGLLSGTCVDSIALNSSNQFVLSSCPGAASSIQNASTSVTSSTGSNYVLTTGTVSGGTGTLTNILPTNGIAVSGGNLQLSLTNATYQTPSGSQLSPTGTTNTSPTMMGMGSTVKLTPVYSGRVTVMFNATGTTAANNNLTVKGYYGTGTAPSNGAGVTGTQFGSTISTFEATTGAAIPSGVSGTITGLTPGTAYWFDLAVNTSSSGTAVVNNVTASVVEF